MTKNQNQHNESDHGLPTEVLFYLLNADGKQEFSSYQAAEAAYKPGDAIMVSFPTEWVE